MSDNFDDIKSDLAEVIKLLKKAAQSTSQGSSGGGVNIDIDSSKNAANVKKEYESLLANHKKILDVKNKFNEVDNKHYADAEMMKSLIEKQKHIEEEIYSILLAKVKTGEKLNDEEKKTFELLEEQLKRRRQIELAQAGFNKLLDIAKTAAFQILNTLKETAMSTEQNNIAVGKLVGGYQNANSAIRQANREILAAYSGLGVTSAEISKGQQDLASNFIGLTGKTTQQIKSMQEGVVELTKIGASGPSAAKGIDVLVNAMGKTPKEAYKIQESFVQMAAKNRLALSDVSEAFAENSSRLSSYGDQAQKVLEGLAEQSMRTGLKISNLIKVAEGFDTFEDAARKVGNLNAIMGGDYFNTVEMVTASDEERIQLLKDGIAASNLDWESMGRRERQALASAAGISDLNEAARVLGFQSEQNAKSQNLEADAQKSLAEQAKTMATMNEKLASTMNSVAIKMDENIDTMRDFTSQLGEVFNKANLTFQALMALGSPALIGAIGAGTTALGTMVGNLASARIQSALAKKGLESVASSMLPGTGASVPAPAGLAGAVPSPAAATGAANPAVANNMTQTGNAAESSVGPILAFGAAILMIGGGIFLASKGLAELVKSFENVKESGAALGAVGVVIGGFILMLLVMIPVITALGTAGEFAAPGLLAVGAAFALIGLGIGLAAFGLSFLVKSFAGLGDAARPAAEALIAVVASISLLAVALILAAPSILGVAAAGAIGAPALIALGIAFVLLGAGVAIAAAGISTMFDSITNLFTVLSVSNSDNIKKSLDALFDSISITGLIAFAKFSSSADVLVESLKYLKDTLQDTVSLMNELDKSSLNTKVNMTAVVESVQTGNTLAQTQSRQQPANQQGPLIPVEQVIAVVPLQVNIGKDKIIDILKKDISDIADERAKIRATRLIDRLNRQGGNVRLTDVAAREILLGDTQ